MSVIKVDKLWEKYRIKFITDGKVRWEEIWALEDVSLSVNKSEIIGIIGQNGAGKTTFLRLLAGMLVPDKGELEVEGKVSAIMELGAGFNPEFTGRENIVLNARSYGINDEMLKQKINEIIEFSNLGKFIDAPIKCYSQGMYMRLAFALAIFAEPDILLIDDILAVGDEEAQQKCRKKIIELKESGKTIILVSHDMSVINRLCDRVILFDQGKIVNQGLPQSVIAYYLDTAGEKSGIGILEQEGLRAVFNNGHIGIAYEGNHVSGSVGGYSSFFDISLKSYFPSTNLSWKIISSSASELVAEGKSGEDGRYLQHFKISLSDSLLSLEVLNRGDPNNQYNFNLFLVSSYNEWVLSDKEGIFPTFAHRVNWFDLNLDVLPGQKLGISASNNNLLPGLVFESGSDGNIMKIFNSGYEQESRIINLYSIDNKNLSLSLKFYPLRNEFDKCMNHERQIVIMKRQEEARRLEEERLAQEEAERRRQEEEAERRRQEEEAERKRQEEARRLEEERLAQEEAERRRQEEEARRLEEEGLAQEEAERKKKEDELIFLKEHTITRNDYRLFIDESFRRIQIYYRDKEITAAGGLHSIIPLSELGDDGFEVKKISGQHLVLKLHFSMFTQIWELIFQEDNVLSLKIELEAKVKVFLEKRYLLFALSDMYQKWQTPYEKGDLISAQYTNEMAPARFKNSRVYSLALSSKETVQPRIVFEINSRDNYLAGLYKRKAGDHEIVHLNFESIIPWGERALPAGRHSLFDAKIIFNCEDKLKKENSPGTSVTTDRKDLKFIFSNGKGSIFRKEKELTFGLGVYTAVRSQGIWYDSCQAMWSLVKKDKQGMVILGKWPYIPISQLWKVEFIADNTIRWIISMEAHKELNIEIEQANIMLLNKYSRWFVQDEAKGKFIDHFTSDYDILPFRYWYGESGKKSLIASGKGLPDVVFRNLDPDLMPRALIENTDYLYSSRLLQYQKNNIKTLTLGNRPYFSGVIKIGNK